jgi:hypothetical protein
VISRIILEEKMSAVGFILNTPIFYDGNKVHLEEKIDFVFADSQSLLQEKSRSVRWVLGLNNQAGKLSRACFAEAEKLCLQKVRGIASARGISELPVDVQSFEWHPASNAIKAKAGGAGAGAGAGGIENQDPGPNYVDIRNRMMQLPQNRTSYKALSACTNIFYVTIDPDSKLLPNILTEINAACDPVKGPPPLSISGHYEYHLEETALVRADGTLNWEGFLLDSLSEADAAFKKEFAEQTFTVTTKLTAVQADSYRTQDLKDNIEAVEVYQKVKSADAEKYPISEKKLENLKQLYAWLLEADAAEGPEVEGAKDYLFQELEDALKALPEEIAVVEEISADNILYPAEPIFAIPLKLQHEGVECGMAKLLLDAKKTASVWGRKSHKSEGPSCVARLDREWKMIRPELTRPPIRFSYKYLTKAPERVLEIPGGLRRFLPRNLSELRGVFRNRKTARQLRTTMYKILSSKPQSGLNPVYTEQRCRYIDFISSEGTTETQVYNPVLRVHNPNMLKRMVTEYIDDQRSFILDGILLRLVGNLSAM